MLRLLALTAALAAPAVDLPELFDDELARIGPKTDVPILLPQSMPDEFHEYHATGFGARAPLGAAARRRAGCGGANACFIASFTGRKRRQARSAPRASARPRPGRALHAA